MVKLMGDRLRELRKTKNLTQSQTAELVGVSVGMISSYENSSRLPSYDVLFKFSNLFHVSTDYLLGKEKERTISISDLTDSQQNSILMIIEEFRKIKQ